MTTVNGILKNNANIVNEVLTHAASNSEKSTNNPLYINTEVLYTDNKFGETTIHLRAAIDEDLTNEYIKLLAQTERSAVLSKYSKEITNTIGQPVDAFALHNLFNKANTVLNDLHKHGSDNAVRVLNDFTKKLNTIYKTFQEQRAQADLEIQRAIFRINELLSVIREGNQILLENQHKKDEQNYVDTQKRIWEATTELAKYFSISTRTIEDGIQDINVVTDREIYNLVGKSTATEFFYNSDCISKINADEPFNSIVMRKLGKAEKSLYAVDDFVVVSSGRNSSDITYKIKDGILGGLLEARDLMLPEMIQKINGMAEHVMKRVNTMHNDLTAPTGLSVLTGSRSFNLDTVIAAQGKALIALIDEQGKPLKYEDNDFIPLELDMAELDHGTGQTNIQSIITRINDYFSAENQRVEVSSIYDVKLVSKSKNIAIGSTLQLGVEVTNAMHNSETGIKVTNLKVTNNVGTEIRSSVSSNISHMIPANIRQKMVNGLSINIESVDNASGLPLISLDYPYTVEMVLETQSERESGPVFTKVIYEISDPALYTNNVNGILGKSFSVKQVLQARPGDNNFGKLRTVNMTNAIQASLVNLQGGNINNADLSGLLELRTNSNKYKIAILQTDRKFSGQANNMDEKMTTGFSEFFGLNDFFRLRDTTELQNYQSAARDIAIREDILKNPKLFSYSTLDLYRKDFGNNNIVSAYEVSVANYKIETLWPDIATEISDDIGNLVFNAANKERGLNSLHQNHVSIQEYIEASLNTKQGVSDNQLKLDLFTLTKRQEAAATSFACTQKLWEVFINKF